MGFMTRFSPRARWNGIADCTAATSAVQGAHRPCEEAAPDGWRGLTEYAIPCRIIMGGFCVMNMTSMNISLPEPLKLFVEEQVSKGGYSTASEYLRELIREAQRRTERREWEAKLLAGLQSPSGELTADDLAALRERILARGPEIR